MILNGDPWSSSGSGDTTVLYQSLNAIAVTGRRFEYPGEILIGTPFVPRQRINNALRQVVIAEAHRIAVTQRSLSDLGGRPHANTVK